MKYSQLIGALCVAAFIGICYLPWVYIPSIHSTVTGLRSEGTFFGKPGLLNIILSLTCFIFFVINRLWAKRTNVFIAVVNFAWTIRNFILLTTCQSGECPEKRIGLYLQVLAGLVILIMTFLPNIRIEEEK